MSNDMQKIEKTTDLLKCVLTDSERRELADKMAQNVLTIQSQESELKAISAQYKSEIARLESEQISFAEKVRAGYAMRRVETQIVKDFAQGLVSFYRMDTGEEYKNRTMDAEERQMFLDLQKDGVIT